MKGIGFLYKNKMLYAWFFSMHTRIDILLCGEDQVKLEEIIDLIHTELNRLEKIASYFDPSSELSHVNSSAHLHPVQVSEDLHRMVVLCKEFHKKTDGYFDITMKSDHYSRSTFDQLEIKDHSIFYMQKGLRLDLSGFIKGYALEQIQQILIAKSVVNSLINLGDSSFLALGNHPNGTPWKISIGKEKLQTKDCILNNQCLTTSGNESDKPKHIICPDTRKYIEGLETISVVTNSGIEGEVLSTALFAAPVAKRQELLERFNAQYIN